MVAKRGGLSEEKEPPIPSLVMGTTAERERVRVGKRREKNGYFKAREMLYI